MMRFTGGLPSVPVTMAVLAAAVVALAALTSWSVLFALIPLVMLGCMAMMGPVARRAKDDVRGWPGMCCAIGPRDRSGGEPD